jgi:hypothetical protein
MLLVISNSRLSAGFFPIAAGAVRSLSLLVKLGGQAVHGCDRNHKKAHFQGVFGCQAAPQSTNGGPNGSGPGAKKKAAPQGPL